MSIAIAIFMSNGIAIFMPIAIAIYGNEGKDDDMGELGDCGVVWEKIGNQIETQAAWLKGGIGRR